MKGEIRGVLKLCWMSMRGVLDEYERCVELCCWCVRCVLKIWMSVGDVLERDRQRDMTRRS